MKSKKTVSAANRGPQPASFSQRIRPEIDNHLSTHLSSIPDKAVRDLVGKIERMRASFKVAQYERLLRDMETFDSDLSPEANAALVRHRRRRLRIALRFLDSDAAKLRRRARLRSPFFNDPHGLYDLLPEFVAVYGFSLFNEVGWREAMKHVERAAFAGDPHAQSILKCIGKLLPTGNAKKEGRGTQVDRQNILTTFRLVIDGVLPEVERAGARTPEEIEKLRVNSGSSFSAANELFKLHANAIATALPSSWSPLHRKASARRLTIEICSLKHSISERTLSRVLSNPFLRRREEDPFLSRYLAKTS